jgi:hypothetical protein
MRLQRSDDADYDAAYFQIWNVEGLHGGVGGLQAVSTRLSIEAFQGSLLAGKDGHHGLAISGILAALNEDQVAVSDGIVDHGVALHTQGIDLSAPGDEGMQV